MKSIRWPRRYGVPTGQGLKPILISVSDIGIYFFWFRFLTIVSGIQNRCSISVLSPATGICRTMVNKSVKKCWRGIITYRYIVFNQPDPTHRLFLNGSSNSYINLAPPSAITYFHLCCWCQRSALWSSRLLFVHQHRWSRDRGFL